MKEQEESSFLDFNLPVNRTGSREDEGEKKTRVRVDIAL